VIVVAALLAVAAPARASGFRLFRSAAVLESSDPNPTPEAFDLGDSPGLAGDEEFELGLRFSPPLAANPAAAFLLSSDEGASGPPRPKWLWIDLAFAATLGGSALNAFHDTPRHKFHFTDEGFFDPGTYAGGADKASHLVDYNAVARLLTGTYELLDLPTDKARVLGSVTSVLAGFMTELGDGTTKYGFSYEDLVMDTVGATSAYLVAHFEAEDLIGFRAGWIPSQKTPPKYAATPPGVGQDYSSNIYTADLRLSGLEKRTKANFWLARYLLLSTTYGTKGYPYAVPELRERQLGIEIGLDVAYIARSLGVPPDKWWGKMLLIVLEIVRFPYTSIGYRYDFNHRKWVGPDNGATFSFPP